MVRRMWVWVAAFALALVASGLLAIQAAPHSRGVLIVDLLTVTLTGNGQGTFATTNSSLVTDGNIYCERSGQITYGTCSHGYADGSSVYYRADAMSGSEVCQLNVGCVTTLYSGSVTMRYGLDTTIDTFWFVLLNPTTLAVQKSGPGGGSVTSNPVGIECGSKCSADFPQNQYITLVPFPTAGSTFVAWSGGCTGTGLCTVLLPSSTTTTTVTAQFDLLATTTPSAAPTAAPTTAPTPKPTAAPTKTPAPAASTPAPAPTALQIAAGSPTESPTESQSANPGASASPGGTASETASAEASVPAQPSETGGSGTPPWPWIGAVALIVGGGVGLALYQVRLRGKLRS